MKTDWGPEVPAGPSAPWCSHGSRLTNVPFFSWGAHHSRRTLHSKTRLHCKIKQIIVKSKFLYAAHPRPGRSDKTFGSGFSDGPLQHKHHDHTVGLSICAECASVF